MSWVSMILDTTGGWVTRILDTSGELGKQDTGYYWWAGCARCWILQVGWVNGIQDTACGQDEQNTKYY